MNYEEKLQNVSVLGAAGKMGSGILLLTAVEMANLKLKPENKSKSFVINAIDVSSESLTGLYQYLKTQVTKIAEKKVVLLRQLYSDNKDLIENSDIINQYVDDVLKIVLFSTRVESSYDSNLIFEAIVEDVDLKLKIYKQILENNNKSPWFLTNTSSIPISELDEEAEINGNIIGFHFYNPPAVQKLVELITSQSTNPDLIKFSNQYAKSIGKIVVPSNDYAGFIGNGHFMRDLLFGIDQAERLKDEMSLPEAIYAVNRISQDFLIRPMGIFQLIDYVGVDVCQKILKVMCSRLEDESLHSNLIDKLMEQGVKGGQNADGSQKDGILQYEKGRPIGVWDPAIKCYVHFNTFSEQIDTKLGCLPQMHKPWKAVVGDRNKEVHFQNYFSELKSMDTLGAILAKEYHFNSNNIGLGLVSNGIADSPENVNTVMLTGFFHAYGPINNYLD